MAVCTLLNAWSARVKGLQLMISLMLVARATGRQVHVYIYIHVEYVHVYTNHSKEYMHTHVYVHTVHILHASGHDSAQSCGCMHELHYHMGPFAMQAWCRSLKRMLGL